MCIRDRRYFVPQPRSRFHGEWDERDTVELRKLVEEHHEELAALILEPVVQLSLIHIFPYA